MDTNDLLQQCQAGDEAAIETLVNQYQREVTLLALSILDDADTPPGEVTAEAEEAAQDAFLAALRALPGYRGESSFKTWLFSITINTCRNRQRKRRALRRLKRALEGWLRQPSDAHPQPEDRLLRRERSSALWQAVCTLGDKHRLPVILRYYHDLPVAEIAALLKISEGTVHSRLFTARERLRDSLEKSGMVEWAAIPQPEDKHGPLLAAVETEGAGRSQAAVSAESDPAALLPGKSPTALGPAALLPGKSPTALGPAALLPGKSPTALGPAAPLPGKSSTALGPARNRRQL